MLYTLKPNERSKGKCRSEKPLAQRCTRKAGEDPQFAMSLECSWQIKPMLLMKLPVKILISLQPQSSPRAPQGFLATLFWHVWWSRTGRWEPPDPSHTWHKPKPEQSWGLTSFPTHWFCLFRCRPDDVWEARLTWLWRSLPTLLTFEG